MERSEEFFGRCNRWQSDQKRSGRVREVLSLFDVSDDKINLIMETATTIGESYGPYKFGKANFSARWARMLLQQAKAELRDRFPEVFEKRCEGKEEEKFLRETAPTAIFYCVQYGTTKQKKRAVIITDAKIENSSTKINDVGATGRTQPRKVGAGETESKEAEPEKDKVIDLTEEKATVIKMEEDVTSRQTTPAEVPGSKVPTPKLNSTASGLSFPDQPVFIEVFSPKSNSKLLRLELKHLVVEEAGLNSAMSKPNLRKLEEQVKQWPFIKWPHRLIFIYVSSEDNSNTPVFSQQMLDTAFSDWHRNENGRRIGNCFRLYANDHDGPPPTITFS